MGGLEVVCSAARREKYLDSTKAHRFFSLWGFRGIKGIKGWGSVSRGERREEEEKEEKEEEEEGWRRRGGALKLARGAHRCAPRPN